MTDFTYCRGGIGYNPKTSSAIRSIQKLLSITTEGWSEMEAADAHFDGGEWSGPAWGDNWQEEEERVIKVVAHHFGLSPSALGESFHNWQYNESDCYVDSVIHYDPNLTYDAALMNPEANR